MKKQFLICFCVLATTMAYSQSTAATNNYLGTRFLGWDTGNGANPLEIRTNNITRMHINGNTGLTSGFIGIGTSTPLAPLHVFGSQQANAQGWRRGIILGNESTLLWDGGGGQSFFMAHPSSTPNGNWYAGAQNGISTVASVDYAFTVYVNSSNGTLNPLRSTQFYKNVLVEQTGFERRFGVNTLNPARDAEIRSNLTQAPQFRLTTVNNSWVDFETNAAGNLQIMPQNGSVGINLNTNPTANLDVNGNARIRNVQAATPDALFVGVRNATNPNDLNVRRLDFTGNASQVLLGNGTWGTLPNTISANNGITLTPAGVIQIGEPYNAPATVPLLNNREVRINNRNFVFSRSNLGNSGKVGIGQIFPSAPTEQLDVDGNIRVRSVPSTSAEYIMTGKQVGGNLNDIVFRKIAFPNDNTQVLLGDGTWGTPSMTDTDDQNLTSATLNGTILTVAIENGSPVSVDLTTLQDGIGTDDQNLTSATLNGTLLTIAIENGSPVTVDLTTLQDGIGTDDQNLTSATLNGTLLTIAIENGTPVTVDLSSLVTTGGGSTGAHNGTSMSTIDNTKIAFGQNLFQAGNPGQLLSSREVPMNNYNVVFTDNNAINNSQNRIGVGTLNPGARMHIKVNDQLQESYPKALIVDNNQINLSNSSTSNTGQLINVSGANANSGLNVSTSGGTNTAGIGVYSVNGSNQNVGITSVAMNTGTPAQQNTGVMGRGFYGKQNFGGNFDSQSNSTSQTTVNYGVLTQANGPSTVNYGIYASASAGTSNYAGYFQGNVHVTGTLTIPGGTVTASDQLFKTNIQNLNGAMSLINQLQPRTYNLDTQNFVDFNFENDQQMGLIAQEVETVIPTIVSNHIRPAQYDSLGIEIAPEIAYKGVEYEELIPLLIAGMKEQQTVISSKDSLINNLNDRLTQLENCLSGILPMLCQMNQSMVQPTSEEVQQKLKAAIDVKLSDKNAIILNQNVPNPFAESTVISYSIPTTVQKAQIHFYDGSGKLINSVDIVERGSGQLNVFADDLSTGVYTYSLVADGQIVSTKRMMKQ